MDRKSKLLALVMTLIFVALSLLPQSVLAREGDYSIIVEKLSVLGTEGTTNIPLGSTVIHFPNGITEVRDNTNHVLLRAKDSESKTLKMPTNEASACHVYEIPLDSHIKEDIDGRINVYKDGVRVLTAANYSNMNPAVFSKEYDIDIKEASIGIIDVGHLISKCNTVKPPQQEKSVNPNSYPYLDWLFGQHVEYAQDNDVDNMRRFSAYWNVPSSPTSPNGDTCLYIWNGAQPHEDNSPGIAQAIIRFTAAGGWEAAAVYGVDVDEDDEVEWDEFFYSEFIDASVGNSIQGVLNYNTYTQEWYVCVINWTTVTARGFYVDEDPKLDLLENAEIFCDLEGANGVSTNAQMCGDIVFTDITVTDMNNQQIDIDWNPWVSPGWEANLGGLSVVAPSDSTVYLNTAN